MAMDALSSSFVSAASPPQMQTKTTSPLLLPPSSSSPTNTVVSTITPPKKPKTTANDDNRHQKNTRTRTPSLSIRTSRILNKLNNLFNDLMIVNPKHQALSLDPNRVFSNNFSPVDELPPTKCQVTQGSLPSCLDDAYIRNGPNPQYPPPRTEPYHLVDGDAMLHCIKISQGQATFCSRYVKTYKYNIENTIGSAIVPLPLSSFSGENE